MSDPRSILLHIDDSKRVAPRVQLARQLAETFDARVTLQYATTPYLLRYPFAVDASGPALAVLLEDEEAARAAARSAVDAVRAGDARLSWSDEKCDGYDFTARALYSDLVVVGQRDAGDPAAGALPPDFVANLIIESGRPVLVLPFAGASTAAPAKVLLAWKETREAARAVTAALPWLRRAQQVHVACYDAGGVAAVQRLVAWLGCHGVTRVVRDIAPDAEAMAGELLLSRAADIGAELLVMGCFGHSRSREWVLGGASRTVLASMTLPTLLAH